GKILFEKIPSSRDWNPSSTTQISDSGLDSLEEQISPTESLISQDTLDYIFQGFDTSGRRDFTGDSDVQSLGSDKNREEGPEKSLSGSTSSLRDSSKSLFQRLGALYSDNQLLSSPIHRTEGRFYEEMNIQTSTHSAIRLDKLSALADSISNWEDEVPLSSAGN
uniref:Uncharacterized protein n=1 Tax=Phlebotomus papatasi TaxID=29031 RepID=A0A1B0D534_PHLPP